MYKILALILLINAQYCFGQISAGLLGQYDFNGNANDISGNNHHGVVTGAQLTEDRFGNPASAYAFDGGDDILITGFPSDYTNYSFCVWVRYPNFYYQPDAGIVVQLGDTPGLDSQHGALGFSPSFSMPRFNFEHVDTNEVRTNVTDSYDFDTLWHFLVATYDGTTLNFYSDNVLRSSATVTSSIAKNDTVFIGYRSHINSFSAYFHGKIDDVLIYNRPLTVQEIDALFTNTATIPEKLIYAKSVEKIIDPMGRETTDEPNTLLIYIYSDGTTEKVFRTE